MNDGNIRPSYFSILTANVRYDKDLSASEKIFYSEITCLCNSKGFCYCSNSYFSSLYDKDIRTIQLWINKLWNKGYIKIEFDNKTNERKIFIVLDKQDLNILQENKIKENERKEKRHNIVNDFMSAIV